MLNHVKSSKTARGVQVDHFDTSNIKQDAKRFCQLVRMKKSTMSTDRVMPIAGVFRDQMDVLKQCQLDKNENVINVLPTQKTDKELH